jgi:N-acetyl-alpha-D-muramate 1-phosphate uridylyltransferase
LKARDFFNNGKPFLVHNVDVLTDFNLSDLYAYHVKHSPIATLAVKERKTSRSLLVNASNELSGWKNNQTGKTIICKEEKEYRLSPIAFSCVQVLSPEIFPLITETGVFSIMDTYLRLAKNHTILTWRHDDSFWADMGRIDTLKEAEKYKGLF